MNSHPSVTKGGPPQYAASFWEDPRNIVKYKTLLDSLPPNAQPPEWLDPDFINAAYKYLNFANNNAPPAEWKFLNYQDPARTFLQSAQMPPVEFLELPDQRKPLNALELAAQNNTDLQAMIQAVNEGQINPATGVPYQAEDLPAWQQTAFAFFNSPLPSAAFTGLAGFGAGSIFGPPGMAIGGLGGLVVGYLGAKYPDSWIGQKLMLFNWPVEQLEKGLGTVVQIAGAALAEAGSGERAGTVRDVLGNLGAAYQAGALTFDVGLQGWGNFGQWMENLVRLQNEANVTQGIPIWSPGSWVYIFQNRDRLRKNLAGPGQVWQLGVPIPVELQGPAGLAAIVDARRRIASGKETAEQVIADYTFRLGFSGQFANLAGQMGADPLNHTGWLAGRGVRSVAALQGNETLVAALSRPLGGAEPGFVSRFLNKTNPAAPLVEGLMAYREFLRTGFSPRLEGVEPKTVENMTAFDRWLAGVETPERVAEGHLQIEELDAQYLAPETTGMLGRTWAWMRHLTPESKAKTLTGMAANNIQTLISISPDDPLRTVRNYDTWVNTSPAQAAEVAAFLGAAEGQTVRQAIHSAQEMVHQKATIWEATTDIRNLAHQAADVAGMEPGEFVRAVQDPARAPTIHQTLRERAADLDTPTAQAIRNMLDSGAITPDNLGQTFRVFTGDNPAPLNAQVFHAELSVALIEHLENWATEAYKIAPDSSFYRMVHAQKMATSLLVLGFNPMYLMGNVTNDIATRAASGVFGFYDKKVINSFFDRMGIEPYFARTGTGPAETGTFVPQRGAAGVSAVVDAMRAIADEKLIKAKLPPEGLLRKGEVLLSAANRWAPISKVVNKFEAAESLQANYIGMSQMWNRLWRPKIGYRPLPPELVNGLGSIDPRLPPMVEGLIQGAKNMREIEAALFSATARVNLDRMVTEIAGDGGRSASEIKEILTQVNVWDTLDDGLSVAKNITEKQAVFDNVMGAVDNYLDELVQRDLNTRWEEAANRVGSSGFTEAVRLFDEQQFYVAEHWIRHFEAWEEVFNQTADMDRGQAGILIEAQRVRATRDWNRIQHFQDATYRGMFQALGADHPTTAKFTGLLNDVHTTRRSFFQLRDSLYKQFFEGEYPTRTARSEAWLKLQMVLDNAYTQAMVDEAGIQSRMDLALADLMERQFGPETAEISRTWRQRQADFGNERVHLMQAHRAKVSSMPRAEGRAEWTRFLNEEYLPFIKEYYSREVEWMHDVHAVASGKPDQVRFIRELKPEEAKPGAAEGGAPVEGQPIVPEAPPQAPPAAPQAPETLEARANVVRSIVEQAEHPLKPVDEAGNILPVTDKAMRDAILEFGNDEVRRLYNEATPLAEMRPSLVDDAMRRRDYVLDNQIKAKNAGGGDAPADTGPTFTDLEAAYARQVEQHPDLPDGFDPNRALDGDVALPEGTPAESVEVIRNHRQTLYDQAKTLPNVTDEQVTAMFELLDQRAETWARQTGGDPAEWYRNHIAEIRFGDPESLGPRLEQNPSVYPRWYSALEQKIEAIPMESMTVEQLRAAIRTGVKADELKWTGFDEWLRGKEGKVTKAEALQFLRENRVELVEVLKGEGISARDTEVIQRRVALWNELDDIRDPFMNAFRRFKDDGGAIVEADIDRFFFQIRSGDQSAAALNIKLSQLAEPEDLNRTMSVSDILTEYGNDQLYPKVQELADALFNIQQEAEVTTRPQYENWMLPGGENYRELLLTLPAEQIAPRGTELIGPEGQPFRFTTTHFDESNILAHTRYKDRVDIDGNRTLFLEEIQSDWHEQGRREGYRQPQEMIEGIQLRRELNKLEADKIKADMEGRRMSDAELRSYTTRRQTLQASLEILRLKQGRAVPDAPYKNTWPDLTLRRMLMEAAEQGYDQLAWTTGATQNARWNLSNYYSEIAISRNQAPLAGRGTYAIEGTRVGDQGLYPIASATREEIANYVGETMAARALEKLDKELHGVAAFTGDQMEVGGEGMRTFYDEFLPRKANELGKKFGVEVRRGEVLIDKPPRDIPGTRQLENGQWVSEGWVLPITDEMRASLERTGIPIFQSSKGAIQFLNDGRAIITGFKGGDVSTMVHETGHIFRRQITGDVLDAYAQYTGYKDGAELTRTQNLFDAGLLDEASTTKYRAAEETFARGFERYLAGEQAGLTAKMRTLFEQFKNWLLDIYKRIKGSDIDIDIDVPIRRADGTTTSLRQIFDDLLGVEREQANALAVQDALDRQVIAGRELQRYVGEITGSLSDETPYGSLFQEAPIPDEFGGLTRRQLDERIQAIKDLGDRATEDQLAALAKLEKARAELEALSQELLDKLGEEPAPQPIGPEYQLGPGEPAAEGPLPPGSLEHVATPRYGGMQEAQGFGDVVRPILEAIRERVMRGEGTDTTFNLNADLAPEMIEQLRGYVRSLEGDMATAKLAAVNWGENRRNAALLPYHRRYGVDNMINVQYPYSFFFLRSFFQWALRFIDKASWFSNTARLRDFQRRGAQRYNWPSRLQGKVFMPAPYLPEWAGEGVYVDPLKYGNPLEIFTSPLDFYMRDKNEVEQRAEENLMRQISAGEVDRQAALEQIDKKSGPLWDAALAQAADELDKNEGSAFDFMNTMLSPSLPFTILKNINQNTPQKISVLPITRTGQALRGIAQDLPFPFNMLSVAGDILAKPEEWLRQRAGLSEFGEWGPYYVDRALSNMATEGDYTAEEILTAMIEKKGPAYEEATGRVRLEMALRTPGGLTGYAILHSANPGDILGSMLYGWMPAGLFPPAELEQRGLKDVYEKAREQYNMGYKDAINKFFDENPEYKARLALWDEPEGRLRHFLVNEIWEGYFNQTTDNRRLISNQLGEQFQTAFLDNNTRSYDSIALDTLAAWAQRLGAPVPETELLPPDNISSLLQQAGLLPATLNLLPDELANPLKDYKAKRDADYPNWFALQQRYYSLQSKGDKQDFLQQFPELSDYWEANRQFKADHPELLPFLEAYQYQQWHIENGRAPVTIEGDGVDAYTRAFWQWRKDYGRPTGGGSGATRLYRYPSGISRPLREKLQDYYRSGRLSPRARSKLYTVWATSGYPSGDFNLWLDVVMRNVFTKASRLSRAQAQQAPARQSARAEFTGPLERKLRSYYLTGERLGPGALKKLKAIWQDSDRPGTNFQDWLDRIVKQTYMQMVERS